MRSALMAKFNVDVHAVILATGHSARDVYKMLDVNNISLEPKPFALGVRVEHQQQHIDQIQYGQCPRLEGLPASSYSLTFSGRDRAVFSFCMCPGGLIIPAATAPEEIVVNGMSLSRRDSEFANAGVVVSVDDRDFYGIPEIWSAVRCSFSGRY